MNFEEMKDIVRKGIYYGLLPLIMKNEHGCTCYTRVTDDKITYLASDGECIVIYPDMTYKTNYGSITPEGLAAFIEAGIKTASKRKYALAKANARANVIEMQSNLRGKNPSYGELVEIVTETWKIGRRYGLIREFRENGLL